VSEINVALKIASDNACTSYEDLDLLSDDAFKSNIREICGLFVTVHDSQVYLIYQTAREFLLTNPEVSETDNTSLSTGVRWGHTIDAVDAETLMAKVCISLLRFKEFLKCPRIVLMLVVNMVVLKTRGAQSLQEVQERPTPDVHTALCLVLLVPTKIAG
jgi:hypothetical protein